MVTHMYQGKEYGRGLLALAMLLALLLGLPNLLMAACEGDLTQDGRVDELDVAVMARETGRTDCFTTGCASDLNGDGAVDVQDKKILQSELGRKDCSEADMEIPDNDSSAVQGAAGEAVTQEKSLAVEQEERVEAQEEEKQEGKADATEEREEEAQEEVKEGTESPDASESKPLKEVKKKKRKLSRFKDNADGTVTDPETGLMWTREANLTAVPVLYYEARSFIADMNRGDRPNYGYTDWRLPALAELRSLKDFTNYTGEQKYFPPEGHPFEHVQAMNLEKYYEWPTYFWDTKLSWIGSAYCRLVGRNAGICVGFVWAVRGGKKD